MHHDVHLADPGNVSEYTPSGSWHSIASGRSSGGVDLHLHRSGCLVYRYTKIKKMCHREWKFVWKNN